MNKVSVVILTYNQEKYIGKCIESAVNQNTSFQYEILVGDDFSSDGTRDIILDYQQRFPDKVKAVLHPHNMGRNGLFNTIETLKQATGDYISIMDGDDYFLDPDKLQKQADMLDANPSYSACFHNTFLLYEDAKNVCSGDKKYPVTENPTGLVPQEEGAAYFVLNPPTQKRLNTIEDFIGEDEVWFIGTSSFLYRRELMYYPDWAIDSVSGDIPRYVILANRGPIGYLPDIMSIYRKNVGGVSLSDNYRDVGFLQNRIAMYEGINKETGYKFDTTIKLNQSRYHRLMIHAKNYEKNFPRRLQAFLKYIKTADVSGRQILKIFRDEVLPKTMLGMYSFVMLLPYRLWEEMPFVDNITQEI